MSETTAANAKKSEQLGMSYGKANNILRKNLLFTLVKKCGKDTCYRCGESIDNVDNFSIEHINPWLDSEDPPGLFFDLENISFSHADCNSKARRIKPRRTADEALRRARKSRSGFLGVSYRPDNPNKKYYAHTLMDGKHLYAGCHHTPEEAARAIDKAIIEHRGKDAVTNQSLGLL